MKQHISKLTNFVVSVSKKYPLRIFLSGVLIGSIVAFCWFYSEQGRIQRYRPEKARLSTPN